MRIGIITAMALSRNNQSQYDGFWNDVSEKSFESIRQFINSL